MQILSNDVRIKYNDENLLASSKCKKLKEK